MTTYTLYNEVQGEIMETPYLETFMYLISRIPESDIWEYGVCEEERGERIVNQQALDEWLYDFIGRAF